MRRYKIGTKYFEGTVDITDPCYDKDVWCRMTAEVKAGEYECRIWRHAKKMEYNGREYNDVRVGKIGIYLDGIMPNVKLMKQIGSIGVDAGLAGFFMNKPVCDRLVHHVLSDGGIRHDKQHYVARRAGYGKDAGGGNAGHEPIP